VVVILGGLIARSRMRWNAAVERLRAEPGLVVTEAERGWGGWKFAGLRDPNAPEPAALLAAVGADTGRVEQRWEPYLSLRPEMVLARTRRALRPPPGVALSLAGDTIRAAGTAPLGWVTAARAGGLPPGVAAVDLDGVTTEIPAELKELKETIERELVLFTVASAALDVRDRGPLGRVADAFGRLEAGAAAIGSRAALELAGRADPTGSDSTNQALSQERAEAVLQALAARGVPRSAVSLRAVGTSRPFESPDPAERARINRSVSFHVSLGRGPGRESSQ
jgi:OOP family OmpA-OmpF porin